MKDALVGRERDKLNGMLRAHFFAPALALNDEITLSCASLPSRVLLCFGDSLGLGVCGGVAGMLTVWFPEREGMRYPSKLWGGM